MKKLILLAACLQLASFASADIAEMLFAPSDVFEAQLIPAKQMIRIDPPESDQLHTQFAYTDAEKTYQLRYTFFKQTAKTEDMEVLRFSYMTYAFAIMMNVSGGHLNTKNIRDFKDADVKKEFNGDFGTTVFIQEPDPEYSQGFKYLMLDFFVKINHGIVVRAILFKDAKFGNTIASAKFAPVYHSFRFKD
jgi:hypothetical protein